MSEDAPFRTRRDKGESNPRDLRYPPLPEPLEVGTYDNHTHFDFADGEQPLSLIHI
jgi:TatD DNase family protein